MCYTTLNKHESIEKIRSISDFLKNYYDDIPLIIRDKVHYVIRNNPENDINLLQNGILKEEGSCSIAGYSIIFDNDDIGSVRDSIIAHEFEHIILRENSFPVTNQINELQIFDKISRAINNLLQHQLIYEKLQGIGFNVEQDYMDIIYENFKSQIGFNNNDPLNLMIWGKFLIFYFTDNYGIQNTLFNKNIDDENLTRFIGSYYHRIIRQSRRLLTYFDQQGNDTAEEQISLLKYLVNRYSLTEVLNGYYIEDSSLTEIDFSEN